MSSALETNRASPWYKWNERRSVQGISCSDARMCCHLLWVIMTINRLYCTIQNISTFILNSIIMILKTQPLSASQTIFRSFPLRVQQRDASMDEFERKLLETMANARYRDKLRRLGWVEAEAQIAGRFLGKNHETPMWDLSWFIPSSVVMRV